MMFKRQFNPPADHPDGTNDEKMNPTKEEIEKAAHEYAEEFRYELDLGSWHEKKRDGFTAGAEWALQQVAPKWISVEERLPEIEKDETFHSENVLISYQFGVCEAFYDHENEMWFKSQGYKIKNVTHWMPLPEQPQQ